MKKIIKGYEFTKSNKMLFPTFSPNTKVNLDRKDILKALKSYNCYLARFVSEFDNPKFSKFWYVIKDTYIPLENFSSNTRNQIRKGLKFCETKKVSFETYKKECYEVYRKSILHYNSIPVSKEKFERIHVPEESREYWIVYEKETQIPIAYSCNLIQEKTCNYTFIKYDPDYLSLYPSYALHYEMDRYYLEDRKMKFVNMGAKTLYHETSVQDFVIKKFKYRRAYCKLNIIYRPIVGIGVKILFPFRKIVYKMKVSKLNALLKQHEAAN